VIYWKSWVMKSSERCRRNAMLELRIEPMN
jgi:hypothetical protein